MLTVVNVLKIKTRAIVCSRRYRVFAFGIPSRSRSQ